MNGIQRILPLICAVALASCTPPFDTGEVSPPPEAVAYSDGREGQIDALLTALEHNAAAMAKQSDFNIEAQQVYTTTLALDAVTQFYQDTLPKRGWRESTRVPSNGSSEVILAYQRRDQLFVVVALNLSSYSGTGVLIYTLLAQE